MLPERPQEPGQVEVLLDELRLDSLPRGRLAAQVREQGAIRERSVRALKAQPGKSILTDGSSQLVHALHPGALTRTRPFASPISACGEGSSDW